MHNQDFDIAFKQKAESYLPTPSTQVWNAIQTEIGGAATLSKSAVNGKIAGIAVSAVAVISIALFSLYSFNSDTTTILKQNETQFVATENVITEKALPISNTLEVSESYIINDTKTTSKPTKETAHITTIVSKEAPLEQAITVSAKSNEATIVKPTLAEEITNDVSSEIEVIEAAEKVFEKDEFVTFRFDFQNTTGQDLNSVEIWEEFPDWCDINSIETTSSDNFHTVKTKIHGNYHEVVWKIKGNFSGDTSSEDNQGFIEYKVKLTEDRKASELNKNQPQIK